MGASGSLERFIIRPPIQFERSRALRYRCMMQDDHWSCMNMLTLKSTRECPWHDCRARAYIG